MRRFSKVLAFSAACSAALILTVRHGGDGIRVGADSQLRAATRPTTGKYDLAQLPIFSKTLFYVRENYFDKNRLDPKRMLVGALDFVQRDVPEILIDRWPEHDPKQVTVKVNGQQRSFSIERVDAPWSLRSTLQDIFRFVQPNLQPVPEKEEARRLVEIEMAATNGMLYTLDPHSVLLDVETYKDMRTQTQGKFGGLGIVIEMDKKGRITVKRPMPDTPAMRVGMRAKDHIVRINNESTVNMTLTEAVDRLRGDVDTNVDVYVDRDGVTGSKKFTITRAFIRPPSIDPPARILAVPAGPGQSPSKVGYFHMQHFSANSAGDLADALTLFDREHVKGIIMDLRGDPGGLYEQAQKVADAFVKSGTLVSMVGVGGAQRKDETATDSGHEPTVPLAVLVNQNSASASEIVAGAMKNLDRGVVVGEETFGKGSVQVLFDIPSPISFGEGSDDDKLGLKLTTAQYLTPGDISIQGVGVVPDIETDAMVVQKDGDRSWIRLQPSAHKRREADYEWHLEHPSARHGVKPEETVSFLFQPKTNEKAKPHDDDDDMDDDADDSADNDDENQKPDFLMEFARDLLAQAKTSKRLELVQQSRAYLDKVRAAEDKKLSQALEKQGVDWTAGPASGAEPELQLTLQNTGDAKVEAGTVAHLKGMVKNVGHAPAYRVRAVFDSDNPLFDENEMVFGKLAPGESKSYELAVKVPTSTFTRTDEIKATLYTQRGVTKAGAADLLVNIEGKQRPMFAYSYQTIDDQKGANRDGLVQRGEQVRTLVTVKNIGQGKAPHTEAVLRNGTGQEGILISAGRFEAKDLGPGETKTFSFVYEVRPEYKGDDYQLELSVGDTTLGESVTDKIKVKIAPPGGAAPEPLTGTATVARDDVPLRETPADGALVVGRADKGTAFKVTGKLGAYTRVDVDATRSAFVASADLKSGGAVHGTFKPDWEVTPPLLTVTAPTVAAGDTVHVKGHASDERLVRDVYIRVWNRNAKIPVKKAFYQPNRVTGDRTKMDFDAEIPIGAGSNLVQVFARESNEVQTLQTVVVLKRTGPNLVAGSPDAQASYPSGAAKK
ncbi:MAG TPA: MXAN_5808 family serine peptidase [Polyangia bacterium]|jgi:carboxyl-terminal processing protease|nr:MXAN_5808 family serine peptidase [Polyangia bacterium]